MSHACAMLTASIVVAVVAFLLIEAWPALNQVGLRQFVDDPGWHPLSQQYNLLPMVAATLLTTVGAILIAAPLGIVLALFGQFYAPQWLGLWHRRLIALLAGIPSVVFGWWGLVVLVPILAPLGGSGQSLLAAVVILSLMILPTVALTADAALAGVPVHQIRAAAALGLRRWTIATRVALWSARFGVGAGIALAVARAVGETMAVLMVSGNVVQWPRSMTDPVRTLTANIALELGYATGLHRSALFVSGLLLMFVVAAVVFVSALIRRRHRHA